jgi:SAM-dependent methyltransferase
MDKEDKELLIESYNDRFKKYGHSNDTLGWTKGKHELRYHILLTQWNLENKSVLDFGCGFGDMYNYAKNLGLKIEYYGVDLNKELILEGKKDYPDANLEFRDALESGLSRKYDYILSSGVHNFKIKDNWSFIEKTFELYNEYSLKGFALNFLSNRVDYTLEDTYHSDPVKIVELAYKYSNKIVLRNDYMPFEFTLFVDKQKEFDKDSVVYPEFSKYVTEN